MPNKLTFVLLTLSLVTALLPNRAHATNPLKPYLWKNVVVLYQLKDEPVKEALALNQTIDKNYQLFKQDKLIFIDLTGKYTGKLHAELSSEARETLTKRFKIKDNQSIYIIIGMDGWEKYRQEGRFNPSHFIDIILKYSASNAEK